MSESQKQSEAAILVIGRTLMTKRVKDDTEEMVIFIKLLQEGSSMVEMQNHNLQRRKKDESIILLQITT